MALYYDIDDIMMGEEIVLLVDPLQLSDLQKSSPKGQLKLISVVFQVGANGIGLLDPGSETNRIEKGAKVDLPFWLAHELYLRQAVGVQLPAAYNQKTRKEIQADAACVDLKSRCPYFYELGCMIAPLVRDRTIGSFLLYTFVSRYKEILSKAHRAALAAVPSSSTSYKRRIPL
ncbi:GINS complex [Cinnamomum micranthum f. kanehirae]|uniref:GINS complex n=1 Tax=Cinnamomum micranthum f. kanehirae TaxID=337451 RepID=A0A3S3P2S7_9MAGN|nr:GINS complex [Cinnamomum micranthum f. kanehirae]